MCIKRCMKIACPKKIVPMIGVGFDVFYEAGFTMPDILLYNDL